MKVIDLSHPVTIHSPGWIGYPGLRMWYLQTHQTHGIVSQMIETPLHLSTHIDAEMHGVSGGRDVASIPLERLVGDGVVVDVSSVGEWGIYTPEIVESRVEVRDGDILILYTGWWRFYSGMPEEDLVKYFCKHPGPSRSFMTWATRRRDLVGRAWEASRWQRATRLSRRRPKSSSDTDPSSKTGK